MRLDDELDKEEAKEQLDQIIRMCVEDIWQQYSNENDLMDKYSMKLFVKNLISEMGD